MSWSAVFGTVVMIPFATAAWMLVCRRWFVDQWDNAPLAGLVAFFLATLPLSAREVGMTASRGYLFAFFTGFIVSVFWAWLWQLFLEDTVIDRPRDLDPLEDRWPQWLIDGLGDRDA